MVDDDGIPLTVTDGRTRSVDEIREDWLVEDRWWTGTPVSRHYFEVILDGGRVSLVYREDGIWMIH